MVIMISEENGLIPENSLVENLDIILGKVIHKENKNDPTKVLNTLILVVLLKRMKKYISIKITLNVMVKVIILQK